MAPSCSSRKTPREGRARGGKIATIGKNTKKDHGTSRGGRKGCRMPGGTNGNARAELGILRVKSRGKKRRGPKLNVEPGFPQTPEKRGSRWGPNGDRDAG